MKQSINPNRIELVMDEKKDGMIEIRRGLDDITIGDRHYAQICLYLDAKHFIKGMAVYTDDLPEGIDARYFVRPRMALSKVVREKKRKFGERNAVQIKADNYDWGAWSDNLRHTTMFMAQTIAPARIKEGQYARINSVCEK